MFSALLLAAAPDAGAVSFTWVDGIKIVLIPVFLFILNRVFTRRDKDTDEQRAKTKAREKHVDDELKRLSDLASVFVSSDKLNERFTSIERKQDGHEKRMEGFQQQHERFADEADRRCTALERDAREVQTLRERIAGMEAKLERIPAMDAKLDRLHEMLGGITGKS